MNAQATTQWRMKGREALGFVAAAQRRLSASLCVNDVTMLAAADELWAATRVATAWLGANPCPDSGLGMQIARMLDNCAEVALTAQRVGTDPVADTEAAQRRIGNLMAVISLEAQMLARW